VAPVRVRRADRRRPRRRGERHRPRPGDPAVAPDRPRERGVRTGRRGHAAPARVGLRRDDERRSAHPAPRRPSDRRQRPTDPPKGQGDHATAVEDARRDDEPRRLDGAVLPGPDASSPATTSAARRGRRRSGTPRPTAATAPEARHLQTTRSSATSPARRGGRT
jgi:hypothetical protein